MTEVLTSLSDTVGPSVTPLVTGYDPSFMLPKGHMSFSQLRSYLTCGACYEARYVDGKPGVIRPSMAIGAAFHAALLAARTDRALGREVDYAAIEEAVGPGIDACLAGVSDRDGEVREVRAELGAVKDWDTVKDKARDVIRAMVPEVLAAEPGVPYLGLECRIDFSGMFPFEFTAFADVVLDDPTFTRDLIIKDAKTVGQDRGGDDYTAWQLAAYSLPWRAAGESVGLGVDLVVTTKVPAYRFEPVRATDGEAHRVYDLILQVARDISAGRFLPSPGLIGCEVDHGMPRFYSSAA